MTIHLKPHTATLASMFTVGCQDASAPVSVAAMSATAAYINALSNDPDVMQLQCVITPMLGVMHACLQRGKSLKFLSSSIHQLIVMHIFSTAERASAKCYTANSLFIKR